MKWLKTHIFWAWLISGVVLLAILLSTSPERVGPQGVTLFFGFFYVWIFLTIELLLRLVRPKLKRNLKQSSHFFMTAVLATIPTFTLGLQSLDQLLWRDVLIVMSLAALIIFYWTKRGYN